MLSEKQLSRSQFLRGGAALVGGSALLAACAQAGMAPAAPADGEMAAEAEKPAMTETTEITFLWPHYFFRQEPLAGVDHRDLQR